MARIAVMVALVVTLLAAVGIGRSHRAAVAQDATSTATTGPSLIGAWQWNSFPAEEEVCCGPEPASFAIFHADGTYSEWQPVGGASIGVWRMTGERTADLVFVFPDIDPSLEGFAPGTATFTVKIELDETGDALIAEGSVDVRDAGGVPLTTVEWHRPAVRMTFDTNPATGSIPATPVATPAA